MRRNPLFVQIDYCISSVDGMRNDFQKQDYQGENPLGQHSVACCKVFGSVFDSCRGDPPVALLHWAAPRFEYHDGWSVPEPSNNSGFSGSFDQQRATRRSPLQKGSLVFVSCRLRGHR